MVLESGARLGPYQILDPLGEGGMGEVWKARDTRLDRTVAIKKSVARFSERFEREARSIAALNHPHICTLYDVGPDYLVMEYVEGRPLKGPMPLEEALSLGAQIADALDAAHRHGIVHRDLKPDNILLTRSGVKLLDFGLARRETPAPGDLSDETRTKVITGEGVILGTPHYMAPEQIEGKQADARADIFAFGCVLYEMLTGTRAFPGKSPASIVAAVMAGQPRPVHEFAPSVPTVVELFLQACLAKDPDERWQSARDLKLALSSLAAGSLAPVAATRNSWRARAGWALAALFLIAAAVLAVLVFRGRADAPLPVRFGIDPGKASIKVPQGAVPAISPDGRRVVFAAPGADGQRRLWLRALDSDQLQAVPGTEGAYDPFWSHDSRSIAFGAPQALKRVDLDGGSTRTICAANFIRGGAWSRNDIILFGNLNNPIYRVPAQGGEPRPVTRLNTAAGDRHHVFPVFLPDQTRLLYSAWGTSTTPVRVASLTAGADVTLPIMLSPFAYVAPGYLLFPRGGSILAQRFALDRLQLEGEPVRVADPVAEPPGLAFCPFSVSENGVLAWRTGIGPNVNRLAWFDSSGKEVGAVGQAADYSNPALSPDGNRLAVDVRDPVTRKRDIWLFDLVRGSAARLTTDPADDLDAVWSPDGRQIAFTSDRKGTRDLYVKPADGGEERLLLEVAGNESAEAWSPDGRFLLYNRTAASERDVFMLPMEPGAEPKPQPLIAGKQIQDRAQVCRSGKYVAYVSDDSGRQQVYVQDFPMAGRRWQISAASGVEPQWSPDGRRLYYLEPAGTRAALMAVDVNPAAPNFGVVQPRRVLEFRATASRRNNYAVGAGGNRFLVVVPLEEEPPAPITVLLNWQAMLKR